MSDDAGLEPALRAGLAKLGLEVGPPEVDKLLAYLALIARWTRVYNLTALRDPGEMLSHHLLDSLSVIAPLRREHPPGGRLLDVGSGAGLPGVVIAVLCPDVQVVCVDTVAKKASFIRQVAAELALPNLRAEHSRVEAMKPEAFDTVTSRAFASLADFVHLTMRHLAPGGQWMAMKGRRPDDEIANLPEEVVVRDVEPLLVPGLDAQRCLVWMRPKTLTRTD
jgi:16S rRNA (guanine527-N7)-methyltransferase